MTDRYFVENPIEGRQARLSGAEAHHLAHVMRAKLGDEVVVFDGSGAEFVARVEHLGRSEVELSVVARHPIDRESCVAITLGVALPKGDRRRWLVAKAVELGVARLVPLKTARSQDRESSDASARLRQAVIEASKQCGRNRLMEIAPPQKLSDYLAAASDAPRLLAQPGARSFRSTLDEIAATGARPGAIALAVGPEGGFSPDELGVARDHGWRRVGLGQRILRVETAALALAAAVMLCFERE